MGKKSRTPSVDVDQTFNRFRDETIAARKPKESVLLHWLFLSFSSVSPFFCLACLSDSKGGEWGCRPPTWAYRKGFAYQFKRGQLNCIIYCGFHISHIWLKTQRPLETRYVPSNRRHSGNRCHR